MVDVKERMGVKSIAQKVEKIIERMGNGLRMGNWRLMKAVMLLQYEDLEGRSKMVGEKKNTVQY